MLDNVTTDAVMAAIFDVTSDPTQCFTAYDVTKAARSRTSANVRHSDVRVLVHQLYDNDFLTDYDRLDHSFWSDGRQERAQLFCPVVGGDPSTYDPDAIQVNKQTAADQALQGIKDTADPFRGMIGATGVVAYTPPSKPDPTSSDEVADKKPEPSFTKPVTRQPEPDKLDIVGKVKKRLTDIHRRFFG